METSDFLNALATEGELFIAAAEQAGPDAEVPSCPGWRVRDLVTHQGHVHRWATGFLAGPLRERVPMGTDPVPDGELSGWLREGHRKLLTTLRGAPEDLECFTFLQGSPTARAFWARRQTHETTVHRADAELAAGKGPSGLTPIAAQAAADGVDELVTGFHARPRSRVRSTEPRTLRLRFTDLPDTAWTLRITGEPLQAVRGAAGPYDCEVSGTAEQLYLALWNRRELSGLPTEGDASLTRLWEETAGIG